jgi:DNA-directed RNA polymerase specialized sigma24 family protein
MATAHPISVKETDRLHADERTASDEEFSLLVYRQHRFVFRVAFALLRNAHDTEDIAQETVLKLYRTGRWRGIRDERAFLARVAWRMALDLRRAPAVESIRRRPLRLRRRRKNKLLPRFNRLLSLQFKSNRLPSPLSTRSTE